MKATFANMSRSYIIKTSCVLMLIGFSAGIIAQVELLKPGISFLNRSIWPTLLTLHIWATSISLVAACLSTISFIRYRITFGQWGVWGGLAIVPFAMGALLYYLLKNQPDGGFIMNSTYPTAVRHAFGTVVLLIALGGLSAWKKTRVANLSLKISFAFALLIMVTGVTLAFFQGRLGIMGMPQKAIDYSCLLYTSPSPRDQRGSRMPSSA